MTIKEYCEKMVHEYQSKGNKNVTIGRITACDIGGNGMISEILFNPATIPSDAVVIEKEKRVKGQDYKGANIRISYIKPRCRKSSIDYEHVALA